MARESKLNSTKQLHYQQFLFIDFTQSRQQTMPRIGSILHWESLSQKGGEENESLKFNIHDVKRRVKLLIDLTFHNMMPDHLPSAI
jgi:hypothetical protein